MKPLEWRRKGCVSASRVAYCAAHWRSCFETGVVEMEEERVEREDEPASTLDREVWIDYRRLSLPGMLSVPRGAKGLVLFAHGSGSSRTSPRNREVADRLNRSKLGTLLFDLLTDEEAQDRKRVFDIDLLAQRMVRATHWAAEHKGTADLPVGYFGASTGAAAALSAAVELGSAVSAVVSRGGRPDLVGADLQRVRSPTRLIVGERDEQVLELNRQAYERIPAEKDLVVVPGATHLFEEPGALERVAELAAGWFAKHVAR